MAAKYFKTQASAEKTRGCPQTSIEHNQYIDEDPQHLAVPILYVMIDFKRASEHNCKK